jgi:Fe-S-cluster containining protein
MRAFTPSPAAFEMDEAQLVILLPLRNIPTMSSPFVYERGRPHSFKFKQNSRQLFSSFSRRFAAVLKKLGRTFRPLLSFTAMNDSVFQLCPNCGLCCDSTLFADVELRTGDGAKRLAKLGLSLEKKGQWKLAFAQPCACFDGKLCRIYKDRPKRCRTFECGVLKKVAADEMSADAALKKISEAKILAGKVRGLLCQLGEKNVRLPLTKRYANVMSAPIHLTEKNSELRGELMLAVNDLMQTLQKDFLRQ